MLKLHLIILIQVAKQFSAPVDSFQAVLAQTSFKERLIKTVLPECLVNKRLLQ
jgi:hypothetical protein